MSSTVKTKSCRSKPELSVAMQYARDIEQGDILACKWVKLAIRRHLNDLERAETEPDYPYYFSDDAANHAIGFFHNYLHHSKGEWAGQPFRLSPWQQFILWCLFGWLRKEDGFRRFVVAYVDMGRKNGKSTLASGIGLYLFDADGEPGAHIYTGATKYKQARIVHEEAENMVRSSSALSSRVGIVRDNLHVFATGSKFEPLGKDSKTEDGLNVHGAIIDEYHAHPDDGLVSVLRTAMGSRRQPMMLIITTAGFERMSPCYEQREYVKKVLEGVLEDDSIFGIIYTLDEEEKDADGTVIKPADDWKDKRNWIKANPNLGVSVYLRDLELMCNEAIEAPSKQNAFKTKRLNIWTQTVSLWITPKSWSLNNRPVDETLLLGRPCYAGLDLSTVMDITALCLCFPPLEDELIYQLLWRFWIPEDNMLEKIKKDRVPYDLWREQGYLVATPGNVIDYDFIEAQVKHDAEQFEMKELAYDPYNASQVIVHLTAEGITAFPFRQGFLSMSPAAKDFEKRVLAGELANGCNPIMDWMINCTTVVSDPAGNIKPVKPDRMKESRRIDGVIAAIMATYRASMREKKKQSKYEKEGLVVL